MNAALKEAPPTGEIILGLPAAAYQQRELGVATSGQLQMLRTKTPAHHLAWTKAQDRDTPATLLGRAYHCRVFEPHVFATSYVAPPKDAPRDLRHLRNAKNKGEATLESIAWWDAYEERTRGKFVLDADQFQLIEDMVQGLKANPLVRALLFEHEGDNEVTLRWTDEETGVPCKARADRWLRSMRTMVDLKSTEDASEFAFHRSINTHGYHIQHAHYSAGAAACGEPLDEFLIVAQEKEAPHLARVFRVGAASEQRGFEIRAAGLATLAKCRASGEWPGYPGITEIEIPAYALKD